MAGAAGPRRCNRNNEKGERGGGDLRKENKGGLRDEYVFVCVVVGEKTTTEMVVAAA